MDTIIATFAAIAARAPMATREETETLLAQCQAVNTAGLIALEMRSVPDTVIVQIGEASSTAFGAVNERFNAIQARQIALISQVPSDLRSRMSLRPVLSTEMLINFIDTGAKQVAYIVREEGNDVVALRNGEPIGKVDAHAVSVFGRELVIDRIGRWPLANIEAVSCEDGFAILLEQGTVIELQQSE